MGDRKIKSFLSICLAAALVGLTPAGGLNVRAAEGFAQKVDSGLQVKESEIKQLLTGDLPLPQKVEGMEGATISYDLGDADARYVSLEGTLLKVTRPYAGEGDYSFVLKAKVTMGGESCQKEIPLTIREGLSDDSYAGYVYTCFAAADNGKDVQQIHFFLSEDGLNWTALNGCNPAFLAGKDYQDKIQRLSKNNFKVADGADIAETVSGDASVLFPFEDEGGYGIRDPYFIRGCRKDGSDSGKIWILTTDQNTMSAKFNGDLASNTVGNWGLMASQGSKSMFIYETEDWIHWQRRHVDVGTEIAAGAVWAPEAIYNPEKDNYLVYWSCRVQTDGLNRNRLYCNETEDFVHFGPTKMYEEEPFYQNWIGKELTKADDGFGNIDTSQLWVADETGNPYGTLYRLVKDETNNHIELMAGKTVLDPQVNYSDTDPNRITPYEKDGKAYAAVADLAGLPNIEKAEITYNWFIRESVGNHFQKISQKNMEAMAGAYEGATMFKFFDREEWCIMIDFYGNNRVRYEPYVTYDLSKPDSVVKVKEGYGRTGGDVGCHGGMIPITLKEYNTLLETYNSDEEVENYHPIPYIQADKRRLADTIEELEDAARRTSEYDGFALKQMNRLIAQAQTLQAKENASSAEMDLLAERAAQTIQDTIPEPGREEKEPEAAKVLLSQAKVTLGVKETLSLSAKVSPSGASQEVIYSSSNKKVASVSKGGKVTAKKKGSAVITAKAANGKKATCRVTVKKAPNKVTLKIRTKNLKKGKSFQMKPILPKNTASNRMTYQSSKPKVASVSGTGKVTAKKKGTATITVKTFHGKKASMKVVVK